MKKLGKIVACTLVLVGLTACADTTPTGTAVEDGATAPRNGDNTDPREGWVVVYSDAGRTITKICDGTTLIYWGKGGVGRTSYGGPAAIPDSPECQPD